MTDADAECTFRVHGRKPQFWHPDTGEITPCTGYTRVAGGMKLRLRLPPAGSVFVVFSGAVTADLPEPLVKVEGKPLLPHEITGPWEVRFPPNRGAPESCTLDKLVSWTEMPDDGIKYFSGTSTYLKNFEVSEAWIKGDLQFSKDITLDEYVSALKKNLVKKLESEGTFLEVNVCDEITI